MNKVPLVVIVIVGFALILFVGQNTSPIQARFLWFSAEKPAILWLLLAAAGGFILGVITTLFVKSRGKGESCKVEKNGTESNDLVPPQ